MKTIEWEDLKKDVALSSPYHERLTLQNFTVFANQTFEFIPGINVLVGENGTGKTHVLKALYAWQMARHLAQTGSSGKYEDIFAGTYGVRSAAELQRARNKVAVASGKYGDSQWSVGFQTQSTTDNGARPAVPRPVFIPAIEMMAHARNMNGILRDYADFDRTCFDFLSIVTAHPSSAARSHLALEQLQYLKALVPGNVEWDEAEQRFYLSDKNKRLPYSLVAEGVRKVSALYRLVEFNWLLPGSVLFWDEPEVNINPRWMDEIVEALVLLTRNGVQIFLATHNYVILKQIDLTLRSQRKSGAEDVQARFFALSKGRGGSKAMWADDFADLQPNPILDQYDQMLAEDWRLADQTAGAT